MALGSVQDFDAAPPFSPPLLLHLVLAIPTAAQRSSPCLRDSAVIALNFDMGVLERELVT